MRAKEWPNKLYEIAESQLGYFTAAQARAAGVHQVRLIQLHQSGDIERVSRGVYRLVRFPLSPLGQYMEAALWPQVRRPDANGVISHASALALHELSEVSPAKVHITLPPGLRIRRTVPPHLALHVDSLSPDDVQIVEGVPVTTPVRTIRDVHAAQVGPALVRRAIADGRRTGRLTHAEAERLSLELLNEMPAESSRAREKAATRTNADGTSKKTQQAKRAAAAKRGARLR
ncbi:MAG: type IV toxin-antitoxin system AbiEi family antitoxin domain-containing protein [bacterium]